MYLTWSWDFWFLMAQAMGIITICVEFASYQINNHRKYLLVTSIANVFWMLMFLFMGFYTAMSAILIMLYAAGFGVLRGLLFYWIFAKQSRRRKIAGRIVLYTSLVVLLVSATSAIINLPLQQQRIIQSFGLATGLLFVVGQYLRNKHFLRLFTFMYATVILIGNTPLNMIDEAGVGYYNYMGIFIELSKIISIIVFYILYIQRRRLVQKLVKIKARIKTELEKIKACSGIAQLMSAKIIPAEELEKMTARMVRYELYAVQKHDVLDIKSAEVLTKPVLDDMLLLQEVKNVMPDLIALDEKKLEQKLAEKTR